MQSFFDFEQAPPISVPYRFFLLGPIFGVAAGLLLAWNGPEAFLSRWNPVLLAVLHLLTLGFMLQIMLGALLQILPVAAGANVRQSRFLASLTQAGIVLGTLLLVTGFVGGARWPFRLAIPVLGIPLTLYVLVCGHALLTTKAKGATVLALRLSVPALVPTVVLGSLLASAFGWDRLLPMFPMVSAHVAWGLVGWGVLLVMAVAYLVVPMFQLTPPYPPRLSMLMPVVVLTLLCIWTVLVLAGVAPGLRLVLMVGLAAVVAVFALLTLELQKKRRRKQNDATLSYWRLGMVMLLLSAFLALASQATGDVALVEKLHMLLAVLMVVGVFMSLISGMLYKIVPFLNWLHLQKKVFPVPNMKHMLADKSMAGQFRLHIAALFALALAVFLPQMVTPAGLLLAAASLWLEWNLIGAARLYRRLSEQGGKAQSAMVSAGCGSI